MGLFDKVFDEIGRGIEKFGTKDISEGKSRRGRLTGSQFLGTAGAGGLGKNTLGSANQALKAQFAGKRSETNEKFSDAAETSVRGARTSLLGANVGHQALFGVKEDKTRSPGAQPLPNVGGNERSARAQARQRAIASAQKRFGIGDTVNTSPLGVQGQGATLGKKRLTGE